MSSASAGRSGRPWRRLQAQVLARDPWCQINGPRCTGRSTTADHIIPLSVAPELAEDITNLRGACGPCNYAGGARITNAKRRLTRKPTYTPPQYRAPRTWPL